MYEGSWHRLPTIPAEDNGAEYHKNRLEHTISTRELFQRPDPTWIIQGALPRNSLCVLYGPPGCGKSFVAQSWALAAASGMEWFDAYTRRTQVCYVAAEGEGGVKQRFQALFAHHDLEPEDVPRIRYLLAAPKLMDHSGLEDLIGRVKEHIEEEWRGPTLVVLDTLARVMAGHDENSAGDMTQLVERADSLRKRLRGATVLLIHHTTKDAANYRGHSSLLGAVDTMFRLDGPPKPGPAPWSAVLRCEKSKDAEPPPPLELTLEAEERSLVVAAARVKRLEDLDVKTDPYDEWATLLDLAMITGEYFPRQTISEWRRVARTSEQNFMRHVVLLLEEQYVDREGGARKGSYEYGLTARGRSQAGIRRAMEARERGLET